jgi:hypothetical protein
MKKGKRAFFFEDFPDDRDRISERGISRENRAISRKDFWAITARKNALLQ